jgi:hypothetical protein
MVMRNDYGILPFLVVKDEEVLTATYYNRIPETPQDVGDEFQYDIVNEKDKTYSTILNGLQTDRATCSIVTDDDCGFKINGYVATQEGSFWQITNIVKRLVRKENKQALRFMKETAETEYLLGLVEVDNPWELK